MNNDLEFQLSSNQDFTFSLLTLLAAGYQGSFVAQEILIELKHPSKPLKALEFARAVLQKVSVWFSDFIPSGQPFASVKGRDSASESCKLAFKMLANLKIELEDVSSLVRLVINRNPDSLSDAERAWMMAQIGRFTYASRDYNEFNEKYIVFKNEQYKSWLIESQRAQTEAQLQDFFRIRASYINSGWSSELTSELVGRAKRLLVATSLTIHDCNLLQAQFKGSMQYSDFDFDVQSEQIWVEQGATPVLASLWRCHQFDVLEATKWLDVGFVAPPIAYLWREQGFSPENALQWQNNGIEPSVAGLWHAAEFTPEKALVYIRKGMAVPPQTEFN
jgi:hypothetical protein